SKGVQWTPDLRSHGPPGPRRIPTALSPARGRGGARELLTPRYSPLATRHSLLALRRIRASSQAAPASTGSVATKTLGTPKPAATMLPTTGPPPLPAAFAVVSRPKAAPRLRAGE